MLGSLVRFLPLGLSENLKGFRAFSRKCRQQAKGANFTQISRNDRRRHSFHVFRLHYVRIERQRAKINGDLLTYFLTYEKRGPSKRGAFLAMTNVSILHSRTENQCVSRHLPKVLLLLIAHVFAKKMLWPNLITKPLAFFFLQTMSPWKWIFPKPSIA